LIDLRLSPYLPKVPNKILKIFGKLAEAWKEKYGKMRSNNNIHNI
jgi:hypothetical protein